MPTSIDLAIQAMTDPENRALFDVTVVCTTDDYQADYWMNRLSQGICRPKPKETRLTDDPNNSNESSQILYPIVLAVSEDWNDDGGAGNGTGTLYAYQKACRLAESKYGIDLAALLAKKEISIALYHTAGKGTRLAPLPASENNNKPGVKLPIVHKINDGSQVCITVLEAVVKQTGIYAPSRKGRLSVFWGDQVFIPSADFLYTPSHHADIMCTLLGSTVPTAEEWTAKGLDKYGVIAVSKSDGRDAAQVEKVDHKTAVKMLQVLGDIGQVGPSLGSFSVSAQLLHALCHEFRSELAEKKGKFDTDPHFWMPLTLPLEDYVVLMSQKGVSEEESTGHHKRMSNLKENFPLNGMGLFGAVDVGMDAAWWDYGQLMLYATNNKKLLDRDDEDSKLLRRFFEITENQMYTNIGDNLTVDEASCIFSSKLKCGTVTKSIVAAVDAVDVSIDSAIVVNCTAKRIVAGKNSILYNIISDSDDGIVANDGEVIVAVTNESGEMMWVRSNANICGGKSWKVLVADNSMSFEQIHERNLAVNVTLIEAKRTQLYKKVSSSFSDLNN